nr:reverse transcriptase domain-containing protein [Tanacetum cinerariifolium]
MRTRSSSNLIVESFMILKRRNRRRSKQIVEPELRTIIETIVFTMADMRTMSELLQAPTEGYGDAIVLPSILVKNFELKVGLLTLVTLSQFHGFERNDPHSHISWLNKITSTLKYKNVPHEAIKLMLFPFSLEGAARTWLEKEPPRYASLKTSSPVPVKSVEEICVTCRGSHPYYECLATANNTFNASVATVTYNQREAFTPGTYSYSHDSRGRKPIGCLTGWCCRRCLCEIWKVHFLADFVVVDYDVDPRVPLILGRTFLRTARALINVYGEELTLQVNDEAITFNVRHTSRYYYRYDDESVNRIDVIDVTCEEYAQKVLEFSNSSTSGNPTPSDPIIATYSPSFTPFEGSEFILEEIETFLRTPDELSTLDDDFDPKGDIALIEKLLNEDPSLNLPLMKNGVLKKINVTMKKPSIEEPPELELKDLPPYLEYAFLEGTYK